VRRIRHDTSELFPADLPAEATFSAMMITGVSNTKREPRTVFARATDCELICLLSETAANWLRPDFPFRKMAMEQGQALLDFQHLSWTQV
jgi:hypothetical protein